MLDYEDARPISSKIVGETDGVPLSKITIYLTTTRLSLKSNLLRTLIVPTFDTKVTEYLCSGWVFFFFRQISTFYLAVFDGIFLYH